METQRVIYYKDWTGQWKEYKFIGPNATGSQLRKALSQVKRDLALNGQAAIFHKNTKR